MKTSQLDQHEITQLTTTYSGSVIVYDSITSTQTRAKELLQAGLSTPFAVAANAQTAGYGRQGRHFFSPADTGLYFSLVFPLSTGTFPPNIGLLTTGMTVVVGTALTDFYPQSNLAYKWVNDIYLNGKKVSGIITELKKVEHQFVGIIGVGINLTTATFPTGLINKAQAIDPQRAINRNHLLAAILNAAATFLPHYQSGTFLPEYRQRSLVLGKKITIHCGQQVISGTATAIDSYGRLVLEDQAGHLHNFASGEVTKVEI